MKRVNVKDVVSEIDNDVDDSPVSDSPSEVSPVSEATTYQEKALNLKKDLYSKLLAIKDKCAALKEPVLLAQAEYNESVRRSPGRPKAGPSIPDEVMAEMREKAVSVIEGMEALRARFAESVSELSFLASEVMSHEGYTFDVTFPSFSNGVTATASALNAGVRLKKALADYAELPSALFLKDYEQIKAALKVYEGIESAYKKESGAVEAALRALRGLAESTSVFERELDRNRHIIPGTVTIWQEPKRTPAAILRAEPTSRGDTSFSLDYDV